MKLRFTLLGISSMYQLTLKQPITTATDNNFDYFFFYLPEKTNPDISCELADDLHKMSRLIFSENRKK